MSTPFPHFPVFFFFPLIVYLSQTGREAAPFNAFAPPNSTKNFPREHSPQTKRIKSSPCMGGCTWGKFSVSEGGLEGESPRSERGGSLPPRSSPPSKSYIQ